MLRFQPGEPDPLLATSQLAFRLLGTSEIVRCMLPLDRSALATRRQLLQRVRVGCLEHPNACLRSTVHLGAEQMMFEQRLHPVEDRGGREIVTGANRLRPSHCPAAAKDRQPPEQPPFVLIEQIVAPGDCVPHRLLARGVIRRPGREQV